jgi:hypothetical protein
MTLAVHGLFLKYDISVTFYEDDLLPAFPGKILLIFFCRVLPMEYVLYTFPGAATPLKTENWG